MTLGAHLQATGESVGNNLQKHPQGPFDNDLHNKSLHWAKSWKPNLTQKVEEFCLIVYFLAINLLSLESLIIPL